MPRRNRGGAPRSRTRAAQVAPPERQPTPERLAQRLVSRGLAAPIILEASEAYTASRRNPDEPS